MPGISEDDPKDPSFTSLTSNYILLEEVGRGAWGIVRKAYHLPTQTSVAIKQIPRNMLSSKLLDREILTLRVASEHHCIIKFIDNAYLVTELAKENLSTRLMSHGAFSEKEASVMVHQILLGIAHMHDNGIAHRDLKLQNILVVGDKPTDVRISDFGLSRFISPSGLMGTACGSPEYVAPEILQNRAYCKGCDLWSLGVIAYALLTQCFPFWSTKITVQYRKIMYGIFSWPKSSTISEIGKDFVRRLLETDPSLRMTAIEAITHPWIAWQGYPPAKLFRDWKTCRHEYESAIKTDIAR